MKKTLLLLLPFVILPFAALFSCAMLASYKIDKSYNYAMGEYRTDMFIPLAPGPDEIWSLTLRKARSDTYTQYQVLAEFEGRKRKAFLRELTLTADGREKTYKKVDHRENSNGVYMIEEAKFIISRDAIEDMALYPDAKIVVRGKRESYTYAVNERAKEGILEFLEVTDDKKQ
jgi:hypothetical protein